MRTTWTALALGLTLVLVACGGRALTNADAVTDASMGVVDAGTPPAEANAPEASNGTCPAGSLWCFTCSGETYCANACPATTCPATLTDAGPPVDAGYQTSPDGGVCPAGMSLCNACGSLFCADGCPGPPPCPTEVPPNACPAQADECFCFATVYCGSDCESNCDPRPANSGWCSQRYGAVRPDEAEASAATPCNGECVQMLEIDASTNGAIPVDYGCVAAPDAGYIPSTDGGCPAGTTFCGACAGSFCAATCPFPCALPGPVP